MQQFLILEDLKYYLDKVGEEDKGFSLNYALNQKYQADNVLDYTENFDRNEFYVSPFPLSKYDFSKGRYQIPKNYLTTKIQEEKRQVNKRL